MSDREKELERLLKSLCNDIDAMRHGTGYWFGAFSDVDGDHVKWLNLGLLRDEIKKKLGF